MCTVALNMFIIYSTLSPTDWRSVRDRGHGAGQDRGLSGRRNQDRKWCTEIAGLGSQVCFHWPSSSVGPCLQGTNNSTDQCVILRTCVCWRILGLIIATHKCFSLKCYSWHLSGFVDILPLLFSFYQTAQSGCPWQLKFIYESHWHYWS